MTLTHPFMQAKWITTDAAPAACPTVTKAFTVTAYESAVLYITGLGYFEARLNGIPVTQDRYQPHVTDYEKRDFKSITYPCRDTFKHRIYYCTYDVTDMLRIGENTLTVTLGGGFYCQKERIAEGDMSYSDQLKTVFALYTDGADTPCTVSDGSEAWRQSEIVYSNLFLGEIHDTTHPDTEEKPVTVCPAPNSILSEALGIPDRVIRTIKPRCLGTVDGRTVYDAGENISGVVRVTKGDGTAVLRYAENRYPDGSLDFRSTGEHYLCTSGKRQIMTDTFCGSGTFEARFSWHAFRYFNVEGDHDDCTVLVIHTDAPVTSTFSSSCEGLSFLYDAFLRTQLDNMHGSIPSDCPHRERLGYTGDGQNCAEAAMLLLDTKEFYRKWIRDIFDAQDTVRGHIQHTAPFQGGGGGPGGWGCAAILVPYAYYKQYGDTTLIRMYFDGMCRFISYLTACMEDGLIVREEEGGWCLGDWCTLEACRLPEPFVNTCFAVKSLRMLSEMAAVIGADDRIPALRALDSQMCNALIRTYSDGVHFAGGIQGADAYALEIGIAPQEAAARLAAQYDARGHFDTGFLGTDILLHVLFETGHADTAMRLLTAESVGSFLYMKRNGATTIWESWDGGGSHNHPMFGGCVRHVYTYLLGITQKTAGWEKIVIAPVVPHELDRIVGSIKTVRGEIAVSWERVQEHLTFTVSVPGDAVFVYEGTETPLSRGTTTLLF